MFINLQNVGTGFPARASELKSMPHPNSLIGHLTTLIVPLAALVLLPACSVNVKDHSGDGHDKVDISTPIGGIHVDEDAEARDTGLPVYPGARPKPDTKDGDKKNANVDLSAFGFGLKVVAIEYQSDDSPGKVIAYYTDQLKKYGNVLHCHSHGSNIGMHHNKEHDDYTSGGKLKCDDNDSGQTIELKAGSDDNQHVVSIDPAGKGSDFALVWVRIRGKEGDI
jgi:hypothetical protein